MSDGDGEMTFGVATHDAGTAVVTVVGELDIANIEPLEAAVAPVINSRPERLIVDVSGLRFADSSAIALWVRWAASVGALELRDPSPLLRRVVTSMGLGERLNVET
jgi:anti-sigma B factor antagonist